MSPTTPPFVPEPRRRRGRDLTAVAVSLALHAGVVAALFLTPAARSLAPPPPPPPIPVTLLRPPEPAPPAATAPPGGGAPAAPEPAKPRQPEPPPAPPTPTPPTAGPVRHVAVRPIAPTMAAAAAAKPQPGFVEISESQLGQAVGAGSGEGSGDGSGAGAGSGSGGGGGCDMAARLQSALSHDGRVISAIASATGARGSTGRGMLVWDGDWIASNGEDGKGLASLRQAILWAVGFSPRECRQATVHGMVLLNVGSRFKIALGADRWRWQDLLNTPTVRTGAIEAP